MDLSAADAAFAGAVDAAVLYKEHAVAAGIEINVIREPNDGYWSAVWMKKGLVHVLLGRPAHRGLDVLDRVLRQRGLERYLLEARPLQTNS